jgi:hypothetical protein
MALPTPHLNKLNALLDNDKLPANGKERTREKYHEWKKAMTDTEGTIPTKACLRSPCRAKPVVNGPELNYR